MMKNIHMIHLEDLLFTEGLEGAQRILQYLTSIHSQLIDPHVSELTFSAKWDGAPSLIVGTDPADGRFFVAKKSVFNNTPIVYKTHEDIDVATLPESLSKIFHLALHHLHTIEMPWTAMQGDLLFTHDTLTSVMIEGREYLLFQPNTLAYAVPANSALAADIRTAQIGIVWHTTYHGTTLSNLIATFNRAILPVITSPATVWQIDATFENRTSLTDTESYTLAKSMTSILSALQAVSFNGLDSILQNPRALAMILKGNNSMVKRGIWLDKPGAMGHEILRFSKERLTTPAGKLALAFITAYGSKNFAACYRFVRAVTQAKRLIIKHFDRHSLMKIFVQTKNGYHEAKPEGYVLSDVSDRVVKLVDRLTFSTQNFNPDIIKGWQR
jgi:hypothetical protein